MSTVTLQPKGVTEEMPDTTPVITGEVVHAEVLPPDVNTKVAAISRLDSPEMQTRAITTMINHARTGLLAAIAAQDLPQVVAWKQKAAAIQEIAKQVRLGKDLQLDAAEFCRRAERGLGVAIRDGQARGVVETTAEGKSRGSRNAKGLEDLNQVIKPRPTDFAKSTELSGPGADNPGIYAMTDGVSDEAFEQALAEARDDQNLSRANVARKAKAKVDVVVLADEKPSQHDLPDDAFRSGGQTLDTPPRPVVTTPQPDIPKKRLTKHDSTEMLANINGMLNGIVESLPFIDPAEIDATDRENKRVIENTRQSMARIRRLLKDIENG